MPSDPTKEAKAEASQILRDIVDEELRITGQTDDAPYFQIGMLRALFADVIAADPAIKKQLEARLAFLKSKPVEQ